MPFNVNQFISNGIVRGGARPSLFDVQIDFPPGLQNLPGGGAPAIREKIRFTCQATSIPASTVASVDVPYFGRTIKVNGDRTFADWSVTIMNDEDYLVRNAFEAWHNNINTIISNRRLTTANGYKATATVRHYSKDGINASIKSYLFSGIFPVNVEEMGLDWDATNRIQTFGVTFAYDYWEPLQTVPPINTRA